jgi:nickel/cobalt exporter
MHSTGQVKHIPRAVRRVSLALAVALVALLPGRVARAHPADMFFNAHTVRLAPAGVEVEWSIAPGPMLTQAVWYDADRDQDEAIDADEARAWSEGRLAEFSATLDGAPLDWRVEAVEWPASATDFQLGDQTILIHLAADWPSGAAAGHRLSLYDSYAETISINWFYLHGVDGVTFHKPVQDNGQLDVEFVLPETGADPQAEPGEGLLTYWDSGIPALSAADQTSGDAAPQTGSPPRRTSQILTGLVRAPEPSPAFYLSALTIALLLGAIHALTPGHGKALVAAYLVGSRGTMRHAATLGGIVTLTHTGSVVALGALTLLISRFLMPTDLFPLLEIASGLLIVGMGISLLRRRWRGFRAATRRRAALRRSHERQSPEREGGSGGTRVTVGQDINARVYDDVLPQGDFSPGVVSWRSLAALGVSGGLVPCPDAIAILLVAVAINRIALGLSLVVAFSLGLALVLIAIGIAVVRSRRLFARVEAFNRVTPALPLVSAVIVLGLGMALTASAARNAVPLLLSPGSPGVAASGDTASAAFDIDRASILYLAPDDQNRYQLFVAPLKGGGPTALTDEPLGVWGHALSPDGVTVAYSAQREGGSAIWSVNADGSDRRQLLDCQELTCSELAWSPGGQRVVFQQLDTTSLDGTGIPSLWWVDPASGESGPVFQDGRLPGYSPGWSPDGEWLSYTAPVGTTSAQVFIYNLSDGRSLSIPNQTGAPVSWSPDGDSLLLNDAYRQDNQYIVHLLRFDIATQELTDLSGDLGTEDMSGAWSPDGEWIVTVRRRLDEPSGSFGNQLWLIRPDGSQPRQLTDEPDIIHGTPVWSPDGRYLLFRRHYLKQSQAQPGLWLLNVETGEVQEIVTPGYDAVWLP